MNLLKGTAVIKVAALFMAILTYVFVENEIRSDQDKVSDPSYKLIKLTAKSLPVKFRLATEVPSGHRIAGEGPVVKPASALVIGPEALLDEAKSAETALIDVSENTKTTTRRVPLESVAGIHLTGEPYMVEVSVPIEKIEPPAPPAEAQPVPAEPQQAPAV